MSDKPAYKRCADKIFPLPDRRRIVGKAAFKAEMNKYRHLKRLVNEAIWEAMLKDREHMTEMHQFLFQESQLKEDTDE